MLARLGMSRSRLGDLAIWLDEAEDDSTTELMRSDERSGAWKLRGDCVAVWGDSSECVESFAVTLVAAEERRSSLAGRWMANLSSEKDATFESRDGGRRSASSANACERACLCSFSGCADDDAEECKAESAEPSTSS